MEESNAQESQIPPWIKNNAGWWAEGIIDDLSFVQGIQYLIKERIVQVSEENEMKEQGIRESKEIPSWIKNNAGWWAKGDIDDDSFIKGLEHLIRENIIDVSTNENKTNQNTTHTNTKNLFENNEWFSEATKGITDTIKKIQADPVLDAVASAGLGAIPVAGPVLSAIYENSRDSPEEKNAQLLIALQNFEKMNKEQLQKQFEIMQENKNEILKNREYLKQLVVDTKNNPSGHIRNKI